MANKRNKVNAVFKNIKIESYININKLYKALKYINNILAAVSYTLLIISIFIFILQCANVKTNIYMKLINAIYSSTQSNNFFISCISILENLGFKRTIIIFLICIFTLLALKIFYLSIVRLYKEQRKLIIIDIIINILFLYIVPFYINAAIAVGYINQTFMHNSISIEKKDYLSEIDIISAEIKNKPLASAIAFSKIIDDAKKDESFIQSLKSSRLIEFTDRINSFVELKGGIFNKTEHYFRNYLDTAPLSLEEMLGSGSISEWILMEPTEAAYHMYGKDGEFNIKFVSADGHFEAVYDKEGNLITAENDAVNMGTYNYADINTDKIKHLEYDVHPYDKWGNTPDSGPKSLMELSLNLEKFYGNQAAKERYENIKSFISNH